MMAFECSYTKFGKPTSSSFSILFMNLTLHFFHQHLTPKSKQPPKNRCRNALSLSLIFSLRPRIFDTLAFPVSFLKFGLAFRNASFFLLCVRGDCTWFGRRWKETTSDHWSKSTCKFVDCVKRDLKPKLSAHCRGRKRRDSLQKGRGTRSVD